MLVKNPKRYFILHILKFICYIFKAIYFTHKNRYLILSNAVPCFDRGIATWYWISYRK